MDAHCVALKLKNQNQALQSGQHSRVLKDVDEIETIKIELEQNVAILLQQNEILHKENEHLKQTYKDLFDSIKVTRSQTKVNSDSLIVQLNNKSIENDELKAQPQDKTYVNAEMRNLMNKMKGKSASPTQASLWHSRLSHFNFDTINLLSKNDIVNGLPKLKFIKEQLDGENLEKMKEKGDPCIFVGYSTQSKGYIVYNNRTRLIVESIHINFDELEDAIALVHNSPGLAPQRHMTFEQNSSSLGIQYTTMNHQETNTDQAVDAQFEAYEFINPFYTPVQEVAESSTSNIDTSNMHIFYQRQRFEYHWTKDHPLEQVRGNPSKPVQTRRQLATDPKMCMFTLIVSTAEPKSIKEGMADYAWIEAMQEELHQFDRLNVWQLVDKPFGKIVINLKWL
ncbi:retrovirus-related pol polyprotein from transposon TNT 1-94 [Tanacetum coccineum]|uniref:Retrovirus-related pol polyprotein from transposon TNT 1-94 n=1 Tax=Tanacetum coccineum TaxID=301880 RepID=A0ABQ4Y526_9ASTR